MEFSELYSHYDRQEERKLAFRRYLERKISSNFLTFYERIQKKLKLGPMILAILFGAVLFLLHLFAALLEGGMGEKQIVIDFSY